MLKFLTLILTLIDRLLDSWGRAKLREEGRQETIKEYNEALNDQIKQAEAAVAVPDPERDERLRDRFGRPGPSGE